MLWIPSRVRAHGMSRAGLDRHQEHTVAWLSGRTILPLLYFHPLERGNCGRWALQCRRRLRAVGTQLVSATLLDRTKAPPERRWNSDFGPKRLRSSTSFDEEPCGARSFVKKCS
jgi:hypothetical protein